MATFFGEIILPSSRAFFDDKDDSDCDTEDLEATVFRDPIIIDGKNTASVKESYNLIIISDGSIARDFVLNYLVNRKEVICEFSIAPEQETHDETEMIYSKKLSTKPTCIATLYKTESGLLYLETNNCLKITHANHLTCNILNWLEKCKDVVIFASRPLSDYKCDKYESMPQNFVKSLVTSSSRLASTCSPMEQPNFISGAAASVMSWCEVKSKKCTLHVCYSDALFSDSVTLSPFLNCLKGTEQGSLIQSKSPQDLKHSNPIHLNVMYQ